MEDRPVRRVKSHVPAAEVYCAGDCAVQAQRAIWGE
jgi:hypothetical protein